MNVELSKSVEVGNGGRIELSFPELTPGITVDVRVTTSATTKRIQTQFGPLRGLIVIHDDFDDPLPDFDDYC